MHESSSHTPLLKKQRLLLETALASFSRMSIKVDFCRNIIGDELLLNFGAKFQR